MSLKLGIEPPYVPTEEEVTIGSLSNLNIGVAVELQSEVVVCVN